MVPDPQAMAQRAITEKLSVRDLERLAGETKTAKTESAVAKGDAKAHDPKSVVAAAHALAERAMARVNGRAA